MCNDYIHSCEELRLSNFVVPSNSSYMANLIRKTVYHFINSKGNLFVGFSVHICTVEKIGSSKCIDVKLIGWLIIS